MADMKENNMNDGVPSLDETAAEAVRLSVGPRPGAGPEKPRKDRRRIIIGAAAVAVAVLVAGGVCAHRAYESHQASVARDACESAVADQAKAVKAYKTLLGSDATVAALKTDAKSVKDARTVDSLKRAAAVRRPAMVKCDASKAADLDAAAAALRGEGAARAVPGARLGGRQVHGGGEGDLVAGRRRGRGGVSDRVRVLCVRGCVCGLGGVGDCLGGGCGRCGFERGGGGLGLVLGQERAVGHEGFLRVLRAVVGGGGVGLVGGAAEDLLER